MSSWKNFAVNDMPERSLYNDAPGVSLGVRSTSLTPYTIDGSPMYGSSSNPGGASSASANMGGSPGDSGASATGSNAPSGGMFGQPLSWWIVLVVLLVGLMWVARRAGEAEEFKSVRLSLYNIFIISLAAIIGLGFFKAVFNRWKVPGLSTYINAI